MAATRPPEPAPEATTTPRAEDAAAPPAAANRGRVLVVDDEESMRFFVQRGLRRLGFAVEAVSDGAEAVRRFDAGFDLAVVDLKMPGMDGLAVLDALRQQDPDATVVLMTAYGTVPSAVDAMRRGAFDYVTKPFELDELVLSLERALEHRAMQRENRDLRRIVDTRTVYAGIVGQSPAMRAVFEAIERLRESDATVLITGESGTGKELVARAIHAQSARALGPFVPLHCAALPDNLLENELFGHEPGAFTGAVTSKRGLLARAEGGTLFLDEVSEISLRAQAKLERFLQEREYVPLGAAEPVNVDLRVIAASNKDLEQGVREGWFRRELFWRLNVVPVHLPPLRVRREDVPALVHACLERYASRHGSAPPAITPDAMVVLTHYDWPGNVRELENAVERVMVLAGDHAVLDIADLPEEMRGQSGTGISDPGEAALLPLQEAIERFERGYFTALLRRTGGNVSEAARLAGLSRGHLHRKARQLGLDSAEFRGS